jgi:hypothetical protein
MRKEETVTVDLLHRAVPAKHTDEGLRALSRETPIHPEGVQKYLQGKFGDAWNSAGHITNLARPAANGDSIAYGCGAVGKVQSCTK